MTWDDLGGGQEADGTNPAGQPSGWRPWRRPADAADLLAGYRAAGPLPDGFEDVVSTVLIMAEPAQVARGRQDPQSAAASIRELRGVR